MENKKQLLSLLDSRQATVGVIGLGYVGIPLLLRFTQVGIKTIGFDIDDRKVDQLNAGRSYIAHIRGESIAEAVRAGFQATTDFSRAKSCDVLIVCVPTPLNQHREPDLGAVIASAHSLVPHIRPGQLVSLESTTYPGTTEEILLPILEQSGLRAGKDFFLVFSPEREDPGNKSFKTQTIPKVVGGFTPDCLEVGVALYGRIVDKVVPVTSTKVAEMSKLLENIHRSVNIGLVNEMKIVADKMGIDIHEVIRAAATKPFGFTAYYPGPGLGGHCIPIDPFYLTWKAKEYGVNTKFIELAGEINTSMPDYVVQKIILALNQQKKSVAGSKVAILGLAYKKNIDDFRESPAIEILHKLHGLGAVLSYCDPFVPEYADAVVGTLTSLSSCLEDIRGFDLAVVVTDHDQFDYNPLLENSQMIVDTRGVYKQRSPKVIKA